MDQPVAIQSGAVFVLSDCSQGRNDDGTRCVNGFKSFEKRLASVAKIHYGAVLPSIPRVAKSATSLHPTFRVRASIPACTEAVSLRPALGHFEVKQVRTANVVLMRLWQRQRQFTMARLRWGIGTPQTDREVAGTWENCRTDYTLPWWSSIHPVWELTRLESPPIWSRSSE